MKVEQFKKAIEAIGRGLPSDGDWMPAFFVEKDGRIGIIGFAGMPDTDEGKDMVAGMMTFLTALTNADAVCFISTAWVGAPNPDGTVTRPSKHPNRKEAVSGMCIGVRGEADGEALMIGYIKRSPNKPPVITHWEMYESEGDDELTTQGRFVDAMREGFERADPEGHLGRLDTFFKEGKQDEGNNT